MRIPENVQNCGLECGKNGVKKKKLRGISSSTSRRTEQPTHQFAPQLFRHFQRAQQYFSGDSA